MKHNSQYQILINLLKKERLSKNITQNQLAETLKTDQTYISKYETLERRIDVVELRKICSAIGVSFTEFISKFDNNLKTHE